MPFVATGTQYEVGNLQVVFHEGDDVNEIIDNAIERIDKEFDGATAYRIVDIKHRRDGRTQTLIQGGSLESFKDTKIVGQIKNYLKSMIDHNYMPVIFEIRLFVSYDEPKL